MQKKNSLILILLLVILVVEIVIMAPEELGLSLEDEKPLPSPPAKQKVAQSQRSQEMKGVYLVGAKDDQKEWELWADKANRERERADWIIEKVKVRFYGDNGVTYLVTGDRGRVMGERNIEISGNVVTHSSNDYVFKTNTATYNSVERTLISPTFVNMTGPKDTDGTQLSLTGADMHANMNTNEIKVQRDVKARKKIKDGKIATISSQRAIFSGKSNYAKFLGNVIIDVETLRISGPEAQFNYKPGTDIIDSMLVSGGIRVTDLDKWATSERVQVHFEEDKFVFNGSPRMVQSGDELRGEEIIFLNGGKKVQVSKARAKVESDKAGSRFDKRTE